MSESKLREMSTDFAVKTIKLCETITRHDSLVNQPERAATSYRRKHPRGKLCTWMKRFHRQIALKECYERECWLELFVKSEILDRETAAGFYNQCGTIRGILIVSVNTAKENTK